MIVPRLRNRIALGALASAGVVLFAVPAFAGEHAEVAPPAQVGEQVVAQDAPQDATATTTRVPGGVSPELVPVLGGLLP